MPNNPARLDITDQRGGRNGRDWPFKLNTNELTEAINVDFAGSMVGRKRRGMSNPGWSGPMVSDGDIIVRMFRHVPGTDETAAELWAMGVTVPNIYRVAGGTVSTKPTLKDNPTNIPGVMSSITAASLNGKLFLTYLSAQARLHVWDGTTVRRVGLAAPGVPAVTNTGSGSYPAVGRYYRTRVVIQAAGVTIYRSEPSPTPGIAIPSGSGAAARVTLGTLPGEGETHWEVEASTDGAFYFLIATVAIGTTTYDDSALVATYVNNPVSAVLNTYKLPVSARFIASDQSRLLLWGDYTTANPQNRVYYTPVLGASDVSDDERVPLNNYYSLDEKDSGTPTAICGPVNGSFLVFKYRQTWKLTPTGDATNPYSVYAVSKTVGCILHSTATIGEDEAGNAAVYWMSTRGPYRYGINGLQYLGKHVEDRILPGGAISSLYTAVLDTNPWASTIWYGDLRQIWFSFLTTTAPNAVPDTTIVYHLGSTATPTSVAEPSGWSVYTGFPISGYHSVMFSSTVGVAMSRDLKPYIAANLPYKADTGTTDLNTSAVATPYQAYITTRALNPYWPGYTMTVQSVALAAVASAATVTASVLNGFGLETRTESVSLAAGGSETRILRRVGGNCQTANAPWVQILIGDTAPVDNSWTLDGIIVSHLQGGPVES